MIKTLLVLSGAVLLTAPSLLAQGRHYEGGGRPVIARGYHRGDYGYYGHHHNGRYYYFGGIPYFYPFYGYGFGYYGGWYGDGFGGPYGYGYDGGGYPGAYEGRVVNPDDDHNAPPVGNGGSLPEAVQRQLAKKGYYKGSIDGQFGPASRSALSRFQREHNLKETGRIDESTLDALGFTDHR